MNKKTNLSLIFSILTLLVFTGSFVYLLKVIKNKNNHTSTVLMTLEQKIIEKENISVLEKRMAELGDTSERIGSYLVDPAGIDTFVEYLEKIGANNKVELSVKSVDVPKSEKNKIIVSFYMVGDFSNIIKVISLLENAPYNITITSSYLNKEIISGNPVPIIVDTAINKKEVPAPIRKVGLQASITFSVLSL